MLCDIHYACVQLIRNHGNSVWWHRLSCCTASYRKALPVLKWLTCMWFGHLVTLCVRYLLLGECHMILHLSGFSQFVVHNPVICWVVEFFDAVHMGWGSGSPNWYVVLLCSSWNPKLTSPIGLTPYRCTPGRWCDHSIIVHPYGHRVN